MPAIKMRVSHYNTFAEGGAAVLMLRLHEALRKVGHDSRVRYRKGNLQLPTVQRLEYCSSWLDRQRERVQHRLESWALKPNPKSYFGRSRLHKPTPPPAEDLKSDILHLHWVSRWLDLPSFLKHAPIHIPIVWTIHDMSSLAGGCFTDFGCDQFADGCKRCPLLKTPFDCLLAAGEWARRKQALQGRRLFVVGNSAFTTRLAVKSGLFRHAEKIVTIHPALNPDQFLRHPKAEARRLLGIPEGRLVLGFGAAALTDENKGLARFFDVAQRVAARLGEIEVLVFGDGLTAAEYSGIHTHSLGRLSSPLFQSLAYSAMDIFVLASRMETFGQVATEAQACGTPVWAFDVGGVPDAVQNGVTGQLVPYNDLAQMAGTIFQAVTSGQLPVMGNQASDWVRAKFNTETMARQYLELYTEAVEPKTYV